MADQMIRIEKCVPLPPSGYKYPWAEMKVGDSFAVSIAKHKSLRSSAASTGRRLKMTFTVRKVGAETVRVWRTK